MMLVFSSDRGKSFDGNTVGMASLAVMCSLDRSGGVNEVNLLDVESHKFI
jgi:hypothetical protein